MGGRQQDMDMSVAAAYAAGGTFQAPMKAPRAPHQQRARSARVPMQEEDMEDLPSVDDMAIAARAAAGAPDPVGPVLRQALGVESEEEDEHVEAQAEAQAVSTHDSPMEEEEKDIHGDEEEEQEEEEDAASSSDDAMSESSEESSSDSDSSDDDDAVMARHVDSPTLRVQLKVGEDERVQLVVKRDAYNPEELRAEIDRMEREGPDAGAEEEEEVEAAQRDEASALPEVEQLDVQISPDDKLLPVGHVSAIVGSIIVVQAPENGRAVTEGSVLCLASREPIGKVEEVFGPVMQPLYSLRYACGPAPPAELAVGAAICALERLTQYVLPEELYVKGYDAGEAEAESEAEADEFEFSDDEKELAWRREQMAQQPAKRKAQEAPRGRGPARGGRHHSSHHSSSDHGPGGRRPGRGRGRSSGRHEGNQQRGFPQGPHAAQGSAGPGPGSFAPAYATYGQPSYGPPQPGSPEFAPMQQPGFYNGFGYPQQYGGYPDQYGQGAHAAGFYQAAPQYMPPQPQQHCGQPRVQGMQGAAPATDAYLSGGQNSRRGGRGHMRGQGRRPPQ
ncbi:g9698 [Coccomyxa elongata]